MLILWVFSLAYASVCAYAYACAYALVKTSLNKLIATYKNAQVIKLQQYVCERLNY